MNNDYRLPAEWEPQSGVLITWPHQFSDWAASLSAIETFFVSLADAILKREKLLIVAYDMAHKNHIETLLKNNGVMSDKLVIFMAETNDTWTRDYGPIILADSQDNLKLMDFTFNAWGDKFVADKDNLISATLLENGVIHSNASEIFEFVLEGGSLDSDGQGTLLTTKQCLLNKNRNPQMSEAEIAEFIQAKLNVSRILWLSEGLIVGDDTDSHIDMLARFTDPDTIVYASCENPGDAHYEPLIKMKQQLESFKKANGKPYTLKALPIPSPVLDDEGDRLPASYANFLIINEAVLLPIYDDKNDEIAIEVMQSCFPNREIIPINARPAITQGGSLHCLTMQLFRGVLN